jgi:hypothetical protein
MSRWFRVYDALLDDPKVQRLPGDLFKLWINLLCVASRHDGRLPASHSDLCFLLRYDENDLDEGLCELEDAGLLDLNGDHYEPHNWVGRQFKSDADPTATERKRRQRDREKGVTRDGHDNVTRTDTDTDTDTEKKEDALRASSSPPKYAFDRGVIKLTRKDYETWKKAFPFIHLDGQLEALAPWASEQKNWFHAIAGALKNANQKAMNDRMTVKAKRKAQGGIGLVE